MRRLLKTPIVLLAMLLPLGPGAFAGSLTRLVGKPLARVQTAGGPAPLRASSSTLATGAVLRPATRLAGLSTGPVVQPQVSRRRLSGLNQLQTILTPAALPRLKPATSLRRDQKGAHR